MSRTVLVTGATGTVSTHLIRALEGVRVRALVRGGAEVEGAEAVPGDLDDPRTLARAFTGVDDVFLLTPNSPRAPENHMNAVWAAKRAGVERIVRMSAVGAAHDAPNMSGRLHALSERELEESGLRYTVIRPHWFMQNLLNEAGEIADAGAFSLDMGAGRIGMIDARDIAETAARLLTAHPEEHHGRTYTLTGPRSLGFDDVAATMSEVLGRRIAYNAVAPAAKAAALLGYGVPAWIVDMIGEYAAAYAAGWGDFTTGTVAALTGRAPRDLADFLRDHAGAFAAR